MQPSQHPNQPVLFFDGQCPMCAWWVRFLYRWGGESNLAFAPLGGKTAQTLLTTYPESSIPDSVILWEPTNTGTPHSTLIQSDAILRVLAIAGGGEGRNLRKSILRIFSHFGWMPKPLRNGVYTLIAKTRIRNKTDGMDEHTMCLIPKGMTFLP